MRDEEDEQKNSRNTLRYFKDFSVKSDEVAAKGSLVAVGTGSEIGSKMNKLQAWVPIGLFVFGFLSEPLALALADLKPEKVHIADAKKNQNYIRDGLITGGDQTIDDVGIKDIRRAPNSGFERIVIDLEGSKKGEPVALERPPYYQVAVTPDEKRLVFSIFGKPRFEFDAKKVLAAFQKSSVIESLVLLPLVEEDSWTFAFELKKGRAVEVFELSDPVRIIMDIRTTR